MVEVASLDDIGILAGERGTVVVFVANGCPTARSYEDRLNALAESLRPRGVNLVAVNSNNAALSPPDTVEEMTRRAHDRGFQFPYVKDPDGALAREFGAVCTPHAFVVDSDRNVVSRRAHRRFSTWRQDHQQGPGERGRRPALGA